jgi:hypothetical protein
VIRLDAATVLLQWATGGLLFLWVTTRRRQVGLGYGWLLRAIYAVMAAGAVLVGASGGHGSTIRDVSAALTTASALGALGVSVVRRKAGVAGARAVAAARSARVEAMTGRSRPPADTSANPATSATSATTATSATSASSASAASAPAAPEFPPVLDLIAPLVGAVGLLAGAHADGGPFVLAAVRTLVGACFLGAVSDAMLLGHWYLVQPGLGRQPLLELVRWVGLTWPLEVGAMLWPTGMVSVFTGAVDDKWGGTLGWFWAACALTTIVLCYVTRKALDERAYSAVMAATGLLYLAILTAFGTDLVARAVLAG